MKYYLKYSLTLKNKMESSTKTDQIENPLNGSPSKGEKKIKVSDYAGRGLDICGVCKQKYNIGDKIPRILIHCGHTFCTSCLLKYHHIDHIRCPYCKKLINNIDSPAKLESLPLNLNIFGEIVKNDPVVMMMIDQTNTNSLATSCPKHPEKQRHFYCSFHEINFCRDCIKASHRQNECCVVDLYDVSKLFQLNEQNIMKNKMIIKCRKKVTDGRMRKEEFFIANY